MATSNNLSWHRSQWAMLDINNLSHAMLFRGDRGLGKFIFAEELARLMLCKCDQKHSNKYDQDASATQASADIAGSKESSTDDNKCASCHLISKQSNPDFFVINHEPGKQIVIDDILSLREFLLTTSHFGGAKVAIINNAEMMNLSSANALLKILEEPPAKKYIFLCSANDLLPTILSRCFQVHFSPPSRSELIEWLQASSEANQDITSKIAAKPEDSGDDLFFAMNNYAPFAVLAALDNFELVAKLNNALKTLEEKLDEKPTTKISQIKWRDYLSLSILDILDIMLWRVHHHLMNYSLSTTKTAIEGDIRSATKARLLLAFRAMLLARRAMIINKINLNREVLLDEILSSFLRAISTLK